MSGTIVQDGTDGADTLAGGGGGIIDGREGHDVADYRFAPGPLILDMTSFYWTPRGLAYVTEDNGSGGVDSLVSIEEIWGSAHGDAVTGGSIPVTLRGLGGDDTLFGGTGGGLIDGGDGDDLLLGGDGAVTFVGGAGNNDIIGGLGRAAVDYSDAPSGIVVSLGGYYAQNGWGGNDFLYGISAVTGSAFADRIVGTHGTQEIRGGGGGDTILLYDDTNPADLVFSPGSAFGEDGDDWIEGNHGANLLSGGTGNDTLFGLGGDDTMAGGSGSNVLVGGAGANVADYSDALHGVRLSLQATLSTAWGMAAVSSDNGFGGIDLLVGFAAVNGSSHGDAITAGDDAAILRGMAGADTLVGGAGNDSLEGGDGDDRLAGRGGSNLLIGGAGHDLADFSGAATGLIIDLAETVLTASGMAALVAVNGFGGSDLLVGMEGAVGSGYADRITAAVTGSHVLGGDGNDSLYGRDGADTLDGGSGNDNLLGGGGDDILIGGGGDDMLYGGAGNDTIYCADVEGVEAGRNAAWGDAGDDFIMGGRGGDAIYGGIGNDTLMGMAGDDILIGGAGSNVLDGGAGTDVADFSTGTRGVHVDMRTGVAYENGFGGVDTLISIEALRGTVFADIMIAGSTSAQFLGYAGDDLLIGGILGGDALNGGDGNDTLVGGGGRDWLVGGAGADTFVIGTLAESGDTIVDFSALDGDRIEFDAASFGLAIGRLADMAVAGNGAARLIHSASGNAATADGWQFIQVGATGALWFDADGTGSAAAVSVASFGAAVVGADSIFFV